MNRPRLCVTLTARTLAGARDGIRSAEADGADLVEIRFDRWPPEERRRAGDLFPAALPLVASFRSLAEGGEGAVDPNERARVLAALARLPFGYIDREVARDPPPSSEPSRWIGSRHLAAPVDWSTFPELVGRGRVDDELAKTVAPATISEFLAHLSPPRSATWAAPGIVQSTGPSGPLSRVWSARIRSPWVFAAPGPSEVLREPPVEAAQVPVDRLASVLNTEPVGPLFALLGHPVLHSGSPALHHEWMRAERLPGAYVALDVETEREFRDLFAELAPGGFRGINVTHPWKELALAVADRGEPSAVLAGAANCLTFSSTGWEAALTDVEAAERRLSELRRDGVWIGNELTLLGSGGAARAVIVAVRKLGGTVRVRARRATAEEELRRRFPETVVGAPKGESGLLVHATPVGRSGASELGVEIRDLVGPTTYCLDFVYRADRPIIRDRIEGAGGRYEDGTALLRYQAEQSYCRWWGHPPPDARGPGVRLASAP
jgi:shikimate dehydrogenase